MDITFPSRLYADTSTVHNQPPTTPGYYVEYEQPAEETGQCGPTLCWVGPYETRPAAATSVLESGRRLSMICRVAVEPSDA